MSTQHMQAERNRKRSIMNWILTLLGAAAAALLIRAFLFEPIRVDGKSMMNTLQDGDVVLVTKPAVLTGDLHRGDIVICRFPDRNTQHTLRVAGTLDLSLTRHTLFVKRLIALPGDELEIREGAVYINGERTDESRIDMGSRSSVSLGPLKLGKDQYFVMGDNRGASNDSRSVGPISRDMIIGRVSRILLPFSRFLQKPQ